MTPVDLRHATVGYSDANIRSTVEAGFHRLLAGVDPWAGLPL